MGTLILAKWTSRQRSDGEMQREFEECNWQEGTLEQTRNLLLTVHEILNNRMQEGKLAQMKKAKLTVLEILQDDKNVPTRKFKLTVYEGVHYVRDDDRVETIVKATHKKKIKPQHEGDNGKNDRFFFLPSVR